MHGTLVIRNDTRAAISFIGCGSWFQVGLTGKGFEQNFGWPQCAQTLTIPRGVSRQKFVMYSGYGSCGAPEQFPPCINGKPPTFPPGKYQARLFQNPSVVPDAPPVTVQVTEARLM